MRHRTTFHYGMPVNHSVNALHLEPRRFPYQKTLSALIRVIPATRLRRFTDLFQNPTHHFELPEPHAMLEIEINLNFCLLSDISIYAIWICASKTTNG